MRCRNARAGVGNLFKAAIAQVPEENSRGPVRILWKFLFDLRIHTSGYKEDVRQAIVIEVDDASAPTGEANFDAEFCLQSLIVEIAGAIVLVQHLCIFGKVGLENIQMAVQIVVADTDSHARLFLSFIAQGYATLYALLFESSVVLIDEKEAGSRVASHIYVGPAVLVEVRCHDSHSIAGPGLPNARLQADVGKGSISIIPVKGVATEGKASGTAGDGKTLPIAVDVGSRPGNVLKVELHVIGDAQIQVTIPVVIEKRAPSAPSDFGGF